MNLQQMEYILAVNKLRHFGEAAEQCGVTQPTLSLMIKKLEEELDIMIFDRSKQPIVPTEIGKRVIQQAETALKEIKKIEELVKSQSESLEGEVRIGIIPTLASYLVADIIRIFTKKYPSIKLKIFEMRTSTLLGAIRKGEIDVMIAATPLNQHDLLEIPVFYEKFVAYFSDTYLNNSTDDKKIKELISANNISTDNLWVLQEGHCLRDQTFNFCKNVGRSNNIYEAGSIDTLIRIVDKNGGYSIIPELHIPLLSADQLNKVIKIDNPPAVREISLIIRKDFIKEALINAISDTIKKIVPNEMINERLKKYSIKL